MAWFNRKPDPISERARALNSEIATLEAEIKRLDTELQRNPPPPRPRLGALPQNIVPSASPVAPRTPSPAVADEPVFVEVGRDRLSSRTEPLTTPQHYNELGVRKYDLPALLRRIRNHFRGPSTTNPKLVSYLAAGGMQGLRPLRYEKRIARNRFIVFAVFLFLGLLGLILWLRPR